MPRRAEEDEKEPAEPARRKKEKSLFRRCYHAVYHWIDARAGRKVVLFYAIFTTCTWILNGVYVYFFPSTMDVGWEHYTIRVCTFILSLSAILSLMGVAGAATRSLRLIRVYMLCMPIGLILNIGNTVQMACLHCNCSKYSQCSALKSFAEFNGKDFVNPFPVPDDVAKFSEIATFPWRPLPEPQVPVKDAASLEQTMLSQSRVDSRSGHVHSLRPSGRLAKAAKLSTLLPGRGVFDMANDESAQSVYSTTSASPLVDADQGNGAQVDCRAPSSSLPEMFVKSNSSGIVAVARKRNVSIKQHLNSNPPADIRRLYTFGPLKNAFENREHPPNCTSSIVKRGSSDLKQEAEDFKAKALACRRDNHKAESTRCPAQLGQALRKCVENDSCGAVHIRITANTSAPESSPQPDDDNDGDDEDVTRHTVNQKEKEQTWTVKMCFLTHPVTKVRLKMDDYYYANDDTRKMDADDTDPAWDQANPLELYFARDMSQKMLGGEKSFGTMVDTMKQAKMSWDQWIDYMKELKKSGCHCMTMSNGCAAYKDKQDVRYWCKIDGHNKELCQKGKLPGGAPLRIALYKMPKSGQTKDGEELLWSKDLCTTNGDTGRDDSSAREAVIKSGNRIQPMCQCSNDIGFKVRGDDVKKVQKKIVDAAFNKEEVLIGYRCNKWYREDTRRWCVVGFDSACADKKVHWISNGEGLRVFMSSIPCQINELPVIIENAASLCRTTQIIWFTVDAIRYALFPVMLALVYFWIKQNCSTVASEVMNSGAWGVEDPLVDPLAQNDDDVLEDKDNWDSEYSDYSYSSSEDESKEKRRDSEAKQEKQSKKEEPEENEKKKSKEKEKKKSDS